jgi:hypothetical protein
MARGEFRSYRGDDVIPSLARQFPEWERFLEETSALSVRPDAAAKAKLPGYLSRLVAWMDWIGAELGLEAVE